MLLFPNQGCVTVRTSAFIGGAHAITIDPANPVSLMKFPLNSQRQAEKRR
ncbi:MAG: hypothetical protein H6Q04_2178 [Acidobacteria bacterium]|nr:hypothetical protein [Acidobacteriota bacterium]